MMGFADGSITLVYILCILSALTCVVYGIINWNSGAETEPDQIREEVDWEANEKELEE